MTKTELEKRFKKMSTSSLIKAIARGGMGKREAHEAATLLSKRIG